MVGGTEPSGEESGNWDVSGGLEEWRLSARLVGEMDGDKKSGLSSLASADGDIKSSESELGLGDRKDEWEWWGENNPA